MQKTYFKTKRYNIIYSLNFIFNIVCIIKKKEREKEREREEEESVNIFFKIN